VLQSDSFKGKNSPVLKVLTSGDIFFQIVDFIAMSKLNDANDQATHLTC